MPYTFKKAEKLCSQKTIGQLFTNGQVVVKYPFRAVFSTDNATKASLCKVMVTVSKKKFKRANKRNLIRRRIKEAYRLQKNILLDALESRNLSMAIAIIYLPAEELDYSNIEKGMKKFLTKLVDAVNTININAHDE